MKQKKDFDSQLPQTCMTDILSQCALNRLCMYVSLSTYLYIRQTHDRFWSNKQTNKQTDFGVTNKQTDFGVTKNYRILPTPFTVRPFSSFTSSTAI